MHITRNHLWMVLSFALLLRLVSLITYPLMDTTEARYGEMARLMVETGNWLTPQFDYGIPFWGKPPLFTWMSAAGIKLFGLNEFAVRLPHWVAGVITIGLIAWMAKKLKMESLIASIVVATCGIFAIAAGAVMTDMALTLAITLTMMGFYFCWSDAPHSRYWGYLGFVGLACGLLAKGPVAIVIVGLAVGPWMLMQKGIVGTFKHLFKQFPMKSGLLIMLAIALPWYILAEIATPGFIDYFIVGEHFKRFLIAGWEGDLYGSAHDQPKGMIWLFWLQSALPWSVVLPVLLVRRRQAYNAQTTGNNEGITSYLILWLISPMLLFTLAGNILPAYVLPGIPALGLLIAQGTKESDLKWLSGIATIVPVVLIIAMMVLNLGTADRKSDRLLLSKVSGAHPVFYVGKRPFSGQFYSQGQAKLLTQPEQLTGHSTYYLVGKEKHITPLIKEQSLSCATQYRAPSKRNLYLCLTD